MSQPNGMFTFDNSALVLIDLQPQMFDAVNSEVPADVIDLNARFLIRVAKLFEMPIVLSSVGVEIGKNDATRTSITDEMPGYDVLDRHTMNAWEDRPSRHWSSGPAASGSSSRRCGPRSAWSTR